MKILLVLLCLLVRIQRAVNTDCFQQMASTYLFYANDNQFIPLGVAPVEYRTGSDNNGAYVDVIMNFQLSADQYSDALNLTQNLRRPIVNYMSFDVPWCTTEVVLTCAISSGFSISKTTGCNILDYDVGEGNTKGRTFVYSDQSEPCGGKTVTARLYNTITSVFAKPTFTYDKDSLFITSDIRFQTSSYLTMEEAIKKYRESTCKSSTSYITTPFFQPQMVCITDRLGATCPTSRPLTEKINEIRPVLQYHCIAELAIPRVMLWSISSYESSTRVVYDVRYGSCRTYSTECKNTFTTNLTATRWLQLGPSRRAFFQSLFADLGSVAIISPRETPTSTTVVESSYTLAPRDPIIGAMPCVCGLNIMCDENGLIVYEPVYIHLNNAIPAAIAGENIVIPLGQDNVTLYGNQSFDPDDLPGLLVLCWKLYSQPRGSPTVVLGQRLSPNLFISTSNFVVGTYSFILYAGDSQDVSYDIVNITVLINVINAIVPADFDQVFILIDKCPTGGVNQLPSPDQCVILDGSASFGTNPEYTLSYQWTQITGNPIAIPYECNESRQVYVEGFFNATSPKACVIPGQYGDYGFLLNVSDNTSFAIARLFIDFESSFNRPNDTGDNSFTNSPDAPTRNYSDPNNSPLFSFPSDSYNTLPPHAPVDDPSNVSAGEFFKTFPEPTIIEKIIVYIVVGIGAIIFILLSGYVIAKDCGNDDDVDDDEEI